MIIRRLLAKSIYILAGKNLLDWIPDDKYLRLVYLLRTGHKLDLLNPIYFGEKINWLKLYDRNPSYNALVDKFEVKKIVEGIIGEEHIIKTFGAWDSYDDIDFNSLPKSFVLKCTHDSGSIVVIKDKNSINHNKYKKYFVKKLKDNLYSYGREWAYKDVKPRIIAEEYMVDESGKELKDYKIFTFGGKAKLIQLDYERFTNHKRQYYSTAWEKIDLEILLKSDNRNFEKPKNLKQMIAFAEKISEGTKFMRVDFYDVCGNVFFGEVTFYPGSGFEKVFSKEWDKILGDWIEIK